MSLCLIFAEDLDPQQKNAFSQWAHLPLDCWTQSHREVFSNTLMHFFMEIRAQGGDLPPNLMNAIKVFPPQALAPLKYPLIQEIRILFSQLFL